MTNLYTKKEGLNSFSFAVFVYLVAQILLSSLLNATQPASFGYCVVYACLPLCVFAIAFGYAKLTNRSFATVTTANVKPKLWHVLWGCLATMGLIHLMLPLNELLLDFIEWCGLKRPNVQFDLPIFALAVITVVLAPIAEEFLFRGTIGNGLTNDKNPVGGILLCGLLFAIFHTNPAQTLHQFVLGTFLMLVAYRSGSVWTSVIVHAFNNLAVVVLSQTVEPTGFYQNNMLLCGIVGAVVFVGSIAGYLLTTKRHANGVQEQDEQPQSVDLTTWLVFGVGVVLCLALWVSNLLGA